MQSDKIKSEFIVEDNLMKTLDSLGYIQRNEINDVVKIENNLKAHLERLNNIELNHNSLKEEEFKLYVLNKIKNNSIFENAKLFRDLIVIPREKNNNIRLKCFDEKIFENNIFEYSHQIVQDSRLNNRCDVTLFLNGFPIVQIELKRSTVDINEAFNQIVRYKQESFNQNIFKILQLFIISNEKITKYFSNNNKLSKELLFNWTDENNHQLLELNIFAESFLNKQNLFKIIIKYMTLLLTEEKIIVLRPYQFYAIEKVLKFIDSNNSLNNEIVNLDERAKKLNSYVWHATGSGKTLTSFKIAQLLSKNSEIHKVIFLVDRTDLNIQTIKEFKSFLGEDSDDLEDTQNSYILAKQLNDPTIKIIVTTIQKLNCILDRNKNLIKDQKLLTENLIFIIDECHRTQFGEMHKKIRMNFSKSRLIGFTGTPIFALNTRDNITTDEIFGQCIHKYLMVNAIRDRSVLKFNIEYIKGPTKKLTLGQDIEVIDIDKEGFFSSDEYHKKIVDFIVFINSNKTQNNYYKSMLVCNNISSAIKYYWMFRNNYSDFKVATVFSKIDNNTPINDNIDDENIEFPRNELDKIIQDYNKVYNVNYDVKNLKQYNANVQSNIVDRFGKIDLVIVVRMLTTGFNAKYLNTIYLDRELKNYDIIQTISRANRVCDKSKNLANIISFRTYKKNVDEAISIYCDPNSDNTIFLKDSLEELITSVNKEIDEMLLKWKNYREVINEYSEIKLKEFISHMKIINKCLNLAKNFIEFKDTMIHLTQEELAEFRSAQQEISKKVEKNIYKESILEDIDFELEVFKTDEINVDYIFYLLNNLKTMQNEVIFKIEIDKIIDKIKKSELKSKALLLEKFISLWSQKMLSEDYDDWKNKDIKQSFNEFKINNIEEKIKKFSQDNGIDYFQLNEIISKKSYENKPIDSYASEIRNSILECPSYLEAQKIVDKAKEFIDNIDSSLYLAQFDDDQINF